MAESLNDSHNAGKNAGHDAEHQAQFVSRAFRYLEEQLTAEEFSDLKLELAADPEKRKAFVQLCLVRAGLIEELRNRAQYRTQLDTLPQSPDHATKITRLQADTYSIESNGDHAARALSDAMILPAITLDPQSPEVDRNPMAPDFGQYETQKISPRWKWMTLRVASILIAVGVGGVLWTVLHRGDSNAGNGNPESPYHASLNSGNPNSGIATQTHPTDNPPTDPLGPLHVNGVLPPQWVDKPPAAHVTIALSARLDADVSPNAILAPGPHTLEQGMIQLTLSTGATVVLQAPAHFEVLSESRITLDRGKLTAVVPHLAHVHADLSIETPDLKAVDLGTEFAVSVVPLELTHLEVFKGQVRAETAADDAGVFASKIVSADQSVRVGFGSTLIQKDLPTPLVFVRGDELQSRATQGGDAGLQRWQAFSSTLRHDPDLIAYYPFDNQTVAPAQLINRALISTGRHDGTLGLSGQPGSIPAWTQGRWVGKAALQFGDKTGSVVTLPADPALTPATEMTIAVWVRRTAQAKTEHLLEEADNDVNCFSLSLTGPGAQPFPRAPEAMYLNYTAVPADALKTPAGALPSDDQWFFITITRDAKSRAKCYIDANVVSESTMSIPDLRRAGELWIGRANPAAKGTSADIFHGQVDELALFHRALSPQEIQRMYEAGKP